MDGLRIWVKFTGKHKETHRFVCDDARTALAMHEGVKQGISMDDLHAFAEACVDVFDEYEGPIPYAEVIQAMASEWEALGQGGYSPAFDMGNAKEAAEYIKGKVSL